MGKIVLRLDRMMVERKMSLNELAERVGISNVNLSKIKNNKVTAVRFSTLAAICEALDCEAGDILEYQKEEQKLMECNLDETTCKRGGQYCILFYSEVKDEYLRNIGYIGEQIDLYLASQNIGALWFGIGKPKDMQKNSLGFVIMISIAKMPEDKFRKDMFKSKRKPLSEIWIGKSLGVAEIVRFTPSACNTQPWIVENTGNDLMVYRYKKPGKRGIMPATDPFEMGVQRLCKHSDLEYIGLYSVRDEDNLASFQTEDAVAGAKAFVRKVMA